MNIFGKELNLKNYSCSRVKYSYTNIHPVINLYIQTTPCCNGKCNFCDTRNHSTEFDFDKLEYIVKTMNENQIMGKIAIAGGEPLLVMERVYKIIELCKHNYITLNTNAFDLNRLREVYSYMKEVDISKHHYNNDVNDNIMGIKTASMEELFKNDLVDKTSINCVFQEGGLTTKEDAIQMIETLGKNHIKNLKLISLLPLTEMAKKNFVSLVALMKEFEDRLNDGYLYDKEMCQCFRFLSVTDSATLVQTTIRETFNDDYSCIKQFVFTGEHLYDGFRKNNILV